MTGLSHLNFRDLTIGTSRNAALRTVIEVDVDIFVAALALGVVWSAGFEGR